MLPDVEVVAAEVHAAWIRSKHAQGVTSRHSEVGEELMVPYAHLSESAKELDRATVRVVYAAIQATQP
jgi:hypothetical protein